MLEKRGPYREGHLGVAKKLIAEGKCLSGGPTGDVGMEVPSGALFVFTDLESAEVGNYVFTAGFVFYAYRCLYVRTSS